MPLAERAVSSAERAGATVDPLAPIGERDAVIKVLQDELTRTIDFVQNERIVALVYLTNERIASLNEMRETLVKERSAMTRDIEHISLKVVDRAFWRAAQLLALVVVALFVAIVAAFFALKTLDSGAPLLGRRPAPKVLKDTDNINRAMGFKYILRGDTGPGFARC